jgi:hypothetical protein
MRGTISASRVRRRVAAALLLTAISAVTLSGCVVRERGYDASYDRRDERRDDRDREDRRDGDRRDYDRRY